MNLLTRLDAWLIAKPYQSLVDWSQKKPVWWAQQSLIASFVMTCIHHALFSTGPAWLSWILLLIGALATAALWLTSLSPAWFAATGGERWVRAVLAALCTQKVLVLCVLPDRHICALLADALFLSFYYFAACQPPRPRVPRAKLGLSPSAT